MAAEVASLVFSVDSAQARKAAGDLDLLARKTGPAAAGAKKVASASSTAGRGISKFTKSIALAAGGLVSFVAIMATVRKSLSVALDFDAALGEASTLIEGTVEEMEFLQQAARDLAKEFGGTGTAQVEAFYQAISAGAGTVQESSELLDTANKLAIGGVTGLVTSVDVLTTATNAYAAAGLASSDAADILFIGVKTGKTTIDQLAGALGQVVPIASAMGVSFTEVVSATAALTTQGQSTRQAVTGLRQILANIVKPATQASEAAKQLGLDFSSTALRTKGLAGFLEDVIDKTGGSQDAMAKLFGSVEALNAVLAFAGGAGDSLNRILGEMEGRAGAATTAYEKMAAQLSERLKVQLALVSDLFLQLGTTILSVMVPAFEMITSNMELLSSVLFVLAATQLPRLVTMLATTAASYLTVTAATTAWTVAVGFLSRAFIFFGGPLALVTGAIALLILNWSDLVALFRKGFGIIESVSAATDRLVESAGNEITQIGLLNKAVKTSTALSLETAETKLKEAKTRLLNIQAIQVEQRLLALGSHEALIIRDQLITQELALAKAEQQRADGSKILDSSIKRIVEQIAAGNLLLDIITAPNATLVEAVAIATESVRILTDAIADQKEGWVLLGDAVIPVTEATKALALATDAQVEAQKKAEAARLAAIKQADDVIIGLRDEIILLGLTNEQQALYNALKQAGVGATSAQGIEIARLLTILRELSEEEERQKLITRDLSNSFKGFFQSIFDGSVKAKDALILLGVQLAEIIVKLLFAKQIAAAGGTGGGGGGLFGGLIGAIVPALVGAAITSFAAPTGFVPPVGAPLSAGAFAHGGSFTVGGRGGQDANLVSFKATRGENVTVTPPGQQSGGNTYFIDASGADPAAIARLEGALLQIAGPGKIERRAVSAVVAARRKDPRLFGV